MQEEEAEQLDHRYLCQALELSLEEQAEGELGLSILVIKIHRLLDLQILVVEVVLE
tara:strand:+ start:298 stop:465 length:168 start_codon:yes stop_codon:yes gene_type:complete